MPPNPLYDRYTEGLPKSEEEESTPGVEDESTPTTATGATVVAGTSVATESVTSSYGRKYRASVAFGFSCEENLKPTDGGRRR